MFVLAWYTALKSHRRPLYWCRLCHSTRRLSMADWSIKWFNQPVMPPLLVHFRRTCRRLKDSSSFTNKLRTLLLPTASQANHYYIVLLLIAAVRHLSYTLFLFSFLSLSFTLFFSLTLFILSTLNSLWLHFQFMCPIHSTTHLFNSLHLHSHNFIY